MSTVACSAAPAGAAGCRAAPARGGHQQPARKGLPPMARATASWGNGAGRQGGRPLARQLPAGKGSRRLRRGDNGGAEVARGVRAFLLRKELF
ncbi:hypothetical protein GW17_00004445 [Ensete ventricosum]|nr:hypothetical protein GW17_00004445 [Ensete ventricosum]